MINLKILFKNTTQYTKAVYDKFLAFHSQKYHFSYVTYTVFISAFILWLLVWQIKYHNFTLAILLCCGFTTFILWRFFRPISDVSKEYKSDKIQKEQIFTFKFYDNFFIIEDDNVYSKIKYYRLYKTFETNDFFYLYLDKKHAFLVDKSCFEKNNSKDFSAFMKKKCWWNYKYFKKSSHN